MTALHPLRCMYIGVLIFTVVAVTLFYESKDLSEPQTLALQWKATVSSPLENLSVVPKVKVQGTVSIPVISVEHAVNPGCLSKKLSQYKPIDTGQVYNHPPIVHYAKLSTSKGSLSLSFREYMAMMSAYKFLKPEKILVHAYTDISGKYWDLTQKWNGTAVTVNRVDRVNTIGGKRVSYVAHQADYIKLQNLLKYGGVTSDFDVIVINGTRVKEMQRISECVLSREGEFVNNGFDCCISNSSFIHKWLDFYHTDYQPRLWIHNASVKPTRILEDKNSSVCYNFYLDDTICVKPNAGQEKMRWLEQNGVDWRTKTAAHYFLKTQFRYNDERLLEEDHSFAEMLRYVYYA